MEAGPETGQEWCLRALEQVLRVHTAHFTGRLLQSAAGYPKPDPYSQ